VVHVKQNKSLRQRVSKAGTTKIHLLPTIILHARTRTLTIINDMRTVKLVIIGNSGVGKTSLRGQVRTTFISFILFGKARLANHQTTVCLWLFLDRLPFNHRYRLHHQDATTSLQPRRIGNAPNLGPSLAPSRVPIAHATLGYCRARALLNALFCVLPWRGCCHSHL